MNSVEGDIESLSASSSSSGPAIFQGFKLPNDGKIGMFQLPPNMNLSKQVASEWFSKRRETIRPWSTFFATSRFKTPVSAQRLPRRIAKNVEYFQSNYLFVFIGLFLYCLIASPLLLFAVMGSFSVCYWIFTRNYGQDRRTVLFGRELTLAQQYSIVGLCSMPVFYIVGAGAALFWVMGASCFLIAIHAAFYDVQSLLEPEEESFELTMEEVV